MKKTIFFAMMAGGLALAPSIAPAQNFAIKAYDNIALGKQLSITEAQPGQSSKSTGNAFGVDFGYTFWRKGAQSLEANIGIGYSFVSSKFAIDGLKYHYSAPAEADMDGNPYERYCEISGLTQKSTLGYFNIPLYIEYQYRPLKWLGLHAEAGFSFGFRTFSSIGGATGKIYSYGIFPEYDDLLIDEPYLDGFGERNLRDAGKGKLSAKPFEASVMCGAGLEFYVYEPVSFVVGVRYNAGLTQIFNGSYDITNSTAYTAETAPVTYTVADGMQVKSLADYTTKSRLSPLSLHVGVNIRF